MSSGIDGRNPTIRLSIIRSQIDRQQQVIALLENRLQETILGGTDVGNIYRDQHLDGLLGEVADVYGDTPVVDSRFGYNNSGVPLDGNGVAVAGLIDASGNINTAAYNAYLALQVTDAQQANAVRLQPAYSGLTGAMQKGITDFQQFDASGAPLPLEQDGLRQLLYQARALMGELRVEEQHWNSEVSEEKSRRKELADFTKG